MEHEHSTVGEVGSPAKQRPKKLGGSAAYNTKFYSKWCSKYPKLDLQLNPQHQMEKLQKNYVLYVLHYVSYGNDSQQESYTLIPWYLILSASP
jgi:hypothetical protein